MKIPKGAKLQTLTRENGEKYHFFRFTYRGEKFYDGDTDRQKAVKLLNRALAKINDLTNQSADLAKDGDTAAELLAHSDNPATKGKGLVEAVKFFVAHYRETDAKSLREHAADYLSMLTANPKTVGEYKRYLDCFCGEHGERKAADITRNDLILHFEKNPSCRAHRERAIRYFFAWLSNTRTGMAKGFIDRPAPIGVDKNPFLAINRTKDERQSPPQVIKADQVVPFLKEAFKNGILPQIAFCLFTGCRPDGEFNRFWKTEFGGWPYISLENQPKLILHKRIVKGGTFQRTIPLHHNLLPWLTFLKDHDAVFRHPNRVKLFRRTKKAILTEEQYYESDIMRHTTVSMLLAIGHHLDEVRLWCGNSPEIIEQHYYDYVTKDDAEKFWAILPSAICGGLSLPQPRTRKRSLSPSSSQTGAAVESVAV